MFEYIGNLDAYEEFSEVKNTYKDEVYIKHKKPFRLINWK